MKKIHKINGKKLQKTLKSQRIKHFKRSKVKRFDDEYGAPVGILIILAFAIIYCIWRCL